MGSSVYISLICGILVITPMFKKISQLILITGLLSLLWLQISSYQAIEPLGIEEVTPEEMIPPLPEVPAKIIVLDPGHGPYVNEEMEPIAPGSSTLKRKYGIGAVGNITGVMEREINLTVGLELRDLLEAAGYTVVMTRIGLDEVLSNIDRVNIANELQADLMLRIHNDSSNNTLVHGASMLVPADVGFAGPIVETSSHYGEIILDTLTQQLGMDNRGVVVREDQTGFNWAKIPIMTVEMGFLSNAQEEQKLIDPDYQSQLAHALFLGIEKCFEE